jgi:hypothetical protein
VDTIDRWGLKTRHLRKHNRDVKRFYGALKDAKLTGETAITFRKRLIKNKDPSIKWGGEKISDPPGSG